MRKKITLFLGALLAFTTVFAQTNPVNGTSNGALVVNEDWYGHQNSSVNYLSPEGEWTYNIISELGGTACYGAIFNGKFYIISKDAKDPGAAKAGGMVTICDAQTLKIEKQIENVDPSKQNFQARSFVGVTAHKGYVSSSDGIYVLDLDSKTITKQVTDANGNGFKGECGNMIAKDGKVYAVTTNNGIAVINAETDQQEASFAGSYVSIVQAKDGSLWANTATTINRLNNETMQAEPVALAAGVSAPYKDFAWTANTFCASAQTNTLYWGYTSGWSGPDHIYKYDIDSQNSAEVIDLTKAAPGWNVYGCSFRVDPTTDELYMSLYKGWSSTDYTVKKFDNEGNLLGDFPMTGKLNYWFPGMFVFPDKPIVTGIHETETSTGVEAMPVARYNVNGQRISTPVKGVNILRMSDGSVRKVIVK